MLNAMKTVTQKYPGARLTICGRDDKNILSGMISDLGLTNNVELKGFVEYENIPSVLNSSDIFVLSSLYESQNMSLIEAAFCGLPLVSTGVGIAPEITDILALPGDSESLAENIIYVIENYSGKSEKALLKIPELKENFSLNKCVNSFIELYKSLV